MKTFPWLATLAVVDLLACIAAVFDLISQYEAIGVIFSVTLIVIFIVLGHYIATANHDEGD